MEEGATRITTSYPYLMENNSIGLRLMTREDTENIVKWRNNKRVRANFVYREEFTIAGHEKWIKTMVETSKVVQLILCEKVTNQPIGSIYFRDIDWEQKEAEYGIFIGEDSAIGKGYGSMGAKLALEFAFRDKKAGGLGLETIGLRVFLDNISAKNSYVSAGFEPVRTIKNVECSDGELKDMLWMEIKKKR